MSKYADITPFYEWLDWLEKESNSRCPEYNTMMFYEIRDKLDDLPELVRCRDCKHYRHDSLACFLVYSPIPPSPNWYPEDFCSYGERKDND